MLGKHHPQRTCESLARQVCCLCAWQALYCSRESVGTSGLSLALSKGGRRYMLRHCKPVGVCLTMHSRRLRSTAWCATAPCRSCWTWRLRATARAMHLMTTTPAHCTPCAPFCVAVCAPADSVLRANATQGCHAAAIIIAPNLLPVLLWLDVARLAVHWAQLCRQFCTGCAWVQSIGVCLPCICATPKLERGH